VSEGVSVREIAALADISTNTVQRWKNGANA
jgi:transposase